MFTRAYTSKSDDLMAEPFGSRIFFTASSSALARDGMSLKPDRWRLENYHRSGGPVLWAHKHDMPAIGSGEGAVGQKLRVGVVFDQEDPFAKSVESKVRRRFIRGSSVGWDFVSHDGAVIPHHRGSAGMLARDSWYDLSELSIVNVPSDPHAVSERHWNTLRSISPGLADLHQAQERWDSDVTEPELRRALIDLCTHMGLDLRYIRSASADDNVVNDEGDDAGDDTKSAPAEEAELEPALTRSAAVDRRAADAILSAFSPLVRA